MHRRETFERLMVQKFPETSPPLPVRALTLAHISGEMRLNCALICIIVHINEASAYEYSYFLFCCLIKRGDGGRDDSDGDRAEQKQSGRVNYDSGAIAVTTAIYGRGSRACVSKFNKATRDDVAHAVEQHTPLTEHNLQNRKELFKHSLRL